jgi:SAM-dependent methyltransferase
VAREGFSVNDVTHENTCTNASDDKGHSGQSTLAFYEEHAQEYFNRTVSADLSSLYERFFQHVKPGGRILDLGSGSGRDLKVMRDRGYIPLGIDASPSLAKLATDFSGETCLTMRFEDLSLPEEFDGVWACASLLHISRCRIPTILKNIHDSLAERGVFFASVQVGVGERLLPDGRFFAYYQAEEFSHLIENAGFTIQQSWLSKDSLSHRRPIDWLNIVAFRKTRSGEMR